MTNNVILFMRARINGFIAPITEELYFRGKSGLPDIYLQVDDVDEVYRDLKGKGVELLIEPQDQSWGARTAKFVDIDRNMFILVQLKK